MARIKKIEKEAKSKNEEKVGEVFKEEEIQRDVSKMEEVLQEEGTHGEGGGGKERQDKTECETDGIGREEGEVQWEDRA